MWSRSVLLLAAVSLAALLEAPVAAAQDGVNSPPQVCFHGFSGDCSGGYGTTGFGTWVEDMMTGEAGRYGDFWLYPSFADVKDPDFYWTPEHVPIAMWFTIYVGCPPASCTLQFTDNQNLVSWTLVGYRERLYTFSHSRTPWIEELLASMQLNVTDVDRQIFGKIVITADDDSNEGACSETDPMPCRKIGVGTLYFNLYPQGESPDWIFRNGVEVF